MNAALRLPAVSHTVQEHRSAASLKKSVCQNLTERIFSQTPALIPRAGWRNWECYIQRCLVLHVSQSCARQCRDSLEQLRCAVSVQATACSRKEREDWGIRALQFPALCAREEVVPAAVPCKTTGPFSTRAESMYFPSQ